MSNSCQSGWGWELASSLVNFEVLKDEPVVVEEASDVLNEREVVGSPCELRSLDVNSHSAEELDVEGRSIESLKLRSTLLKPVEPLLCILEEVPPVRVRNEILGLPAPVNPVELGTLSLEDLWKDEKRHVTMFR
jgi:hypothetical protein